MGGGAKYGPRTTLDDSPTEPLKTEHRTTGPQKTDLRSTQPRKAKPRIRPNVQHDRSLKDSTSNGLNDPQIQPNIERLYI
jgi:hypothetical protein